ncbi:T9SS type A sorting domain-containing protein [Marixanthomonas ophiurae]|uniref:T9SS C-terminal target domain-containing protein n=1 Tax=Marixanthomonas ophiurae TaxID=387659 RepID=A0A3E1QB10_9FLAO|nr:T9SS type A sorting domain-containing protein [Marixanthomonas ophiurae]RFN59322.1 T9SS C-terminal target domain-containing protein [Marixanthomonas ophiurae]
MRLIYFITFLLSVSSVAQIVNIPDANFKNVLLNQNCADFDNDGVYDGDVDTNNDGEIQVSEAEAVLRLRGTNEGIVSVEGIESFVNIEILTLFGNDITEIDLSQLSELTHIFLSGSELTTLDVSQNPNLIRLGAIGNNLSSIDVSNNTLLEIIDIRENQISTLDVSQNIILEELNIGYNLLTSLDVSQNTNLRRLWSWNNELTYLNVRNGNNNSMSVMVATSNKNLPCILVDDENATRPTCTEDWGWCKDEEAIYSEDCTLDIDDFNSDKLTVYPNPANNLIQIDSAMPIKCIKLYNSIGGLVIEKETNVDTIDISNLQSGIYFLQINNFDNRISKKIVKL